MRASFVSILALLGACGPASLLVARSAAAEDPRAADAVWRSEVLAALASDAPLDSAECERLLGAPAARAEPILRGDVAARCGRDAEALAAYGEAWQSGDRGCALAVALADLRARSGETAGARAVLAAVGCREARLGSAWLEVAVDPAAAERTLSALLQRDGDDVEALAALVAVHVARAEHEAAAAVCERANDLDAAPLWLACARAALAGERIHAAEASYRRALATARTIEAHLELGALLLRERRGEEASHAYCTALAREAASYDATLGLARALRLVRRLDDAELAFDRAIELAPERPEAFWYRATYAVPVPNHWESDEETWATHRTLERFVELAGDDPRFRAEVEETTRSCGREPHGTRRVRGTPGCVPGLLQALLMRRGSHELLQVQQEIERMQSDANAAHQPGDSSRQPEPPAPSCVVPWLPSRSAGGLASVDERLTGCVPTHKAVGPAESTTGHWSAMSRDRADRSRAPAAPRPPCRG